MCRWPPTCFRNARALLSLGDFQLRSRDAPESAFPCVDRAEAARAANAMRFGTLVLPRVAASLGALRVDDRAEADRSSTAGAAAHDG